MCVSSKALLALLPGPSVQLHQVQQPGALPAGANKSNLS